MSFIQAIKAKIQSIHNTQKITRAMEMVSASKLRKAQARVLGLRPYTQKIHSLMQRVANGCEAESLPPLFRESIPKRMGIILVTSDRGLCGALNTNLFKTTLAYLNNTSAECEFALIGHQATRFIRSLNQNQVLAHIDFLEESPTNFVLMALIQRMLTHYNEGRLDGLAIAANVFVNTMVQKPSILPLVPIQKVSVQESDLDYLYEPDATSLLTKLALRYIEAHIIQAVIENNACEQAARMLAMKNATESANELTTHLRKSYHKARQAYITQELSEIVSGAEAV